MPGALILALLVLAEPATAQRIGGASVQGGGFGVGADLTPPGIPSSFDCTSGDTQFSCSWTASTGGPDHYEFGYRCPDSGSYTTDSAAVSPEVRTSLTNGVLCGTRVRAIDLAANASDYATDTVTPADVTAPGTPPSLNCTPADTEFTCTWGSSSGGDVAGYQGRYDCGGGFTSWGTQSSGWNVTGRTNDVACDVEVRAFDEVPNYSTAATDTVTPTAGSGLSATYTGPCEVTDTNADASDDCYCTRVRGNGADGTGDALYDSALLHCEDYDRPQLWDVANAATWESDGGPGFGPPYDQTAGCGNWRGCNSWWDQTGSITSTCQWKGAGLPEAMPTPSVGTICGAGLSCGTQLTVDGADPYSVGANNCLNVMTRGGASIASIAWAGALTPGAAFAGNASIEAIHQQGYQGGKLKDWSYTPSTELGYTVAVGFSANHPTTVMATAIKGDQFTSVSAGSDSTSWFMGQTNVPSWQARFPMTGLIYGVCSSATAGATATTGSFGCVADFAINFWNASWSRPVDFFDRYHCIQGHIAGVGTSNVSFEASIDGQVVYSVTGIDGTFLSVQAYDGMQPNHYHNAYSTMSGDAQRVYDQHHLRAGPPVSCQQIGFPAP